MHTSTPEVETVVKRGPCQAAFPMFPTARRLPPLLGMGYLVRRSKRSAATRPQSETKVSARMPRLRLKAT
eukprot:2194331-Lingulodinium_polyedra.AAC.1